MQNTILQYPGKYRAQSTNLALVTEMLLHTCTHTCTCTSSERGQERGHRVDIVNVNVNVNANVNNINNTNNYNYMYNEAKLEVRGCRL